MQGNRSGRGNPNHRATSAYRKALQDAVGPKDVRAILRKLRALAADGDVQAAKVVLGLTLGPDPLHEERMMAEMQPFTTTIVEALARHLSRTPGALRAVLADIGCTAVHTDAGRLFTKWLYGQGEIPEGNGTAPPPATTSRGSFPAGG